MTHCSFSTVRERDMDLLFLESIVTDPGFCELVLEKTDYATSHFGFWMRSCPARSLIWENPISR